MQIDGVSVQAQPDVAGRARSENLTAALLGALLGAFLIWGVGFSPIAALHNAAHDTRHSMAFPCH
jgi:cobalt transporter subunit CbtB